MSDQQPPFGGHPNYAQQWPPYPSILPPTFPTPADRPGVNLQPVSTHGTPFEYNMAGVNANSQVPALGGHANTASFFPPQFPFFNQFDPSQFPPAFPPMPFAPMGYPPIPMPTGSSGAPSASQTQFPQHSQPTSTPAVRSRPSKAIPIRAESSRDKDEASKANSTRRTIRRYSDLEEGETVSSSGRSSGRSSGSPYNPPLSISADPAILDQAMSAQKPVPQPTIPTAPPTKSLAQLRIQAQGALLSLAPHQIRYKELVAEGINPVILKRLYDEVGIKVVLTSEKISSVPEDVPVTNTLGSSHQAAATTLTKESSSAAKSNVSGSQATSPASPQSKDGKPLERKELIARMLAAKVSKANSKETSPVGTTNSAPTPDEIRPTPKEPKAKSKAQTELARQRIEELKRKALLKSQQEAQENPAPVPSESLAPAIHHPLPVRPPLPEPSHPAGLPGLFMTRLEQEPNSAADPTPVSRTTHRKRPLASDFDEPVAPVKKHFNPTANRFKPTERLIIAISDDESLYGDDEDDNMELDSGSEQEPTIGNSILAKPSVQPYTTATRASTSTPQAPSSSNDQGEIRTKDMEIQAMRRKILELELKRKSKLAASRTQSPRTVDDSGASSSSAQSGGADLGALNASLVSDHLKVPETEASEEDSTAASLPLARHDTIPPVAPRSYPDSLAGLQANGEAHQERTPDTMTKVTANNTACALDSFESDSAGSAMDESDDSSSDSSDSSSEDEDESGGSPAQVDTYPPIAPDLSEPMDIDSSEKSISGGSPSAVTQRSANSVEGSGSQCHQSEHSQRESSAESEAYEPPEPEADVQSEDSSYSPPPFSPAPPDPVETTTVPAPSFDLAQTTEELTHTPDVSGPSSQTDLQVGVLGTEASSANSAHKFTPYTSPLRTFKAYRYHPNYAADVPSGFRSLTYSHNIDSMKYFCPYEVAGGVCNDRSCEFQHLRDVTLSDDNILIQMGAAREGQTEEEKETYLAGLKEIINDLRRDKVKDFNTVAAEIAAYRRRFLQDPSRVLSL